MDYSKLPHHRGPYSAVGDRQARFLDTLGAPALHCVNADGSVSSKAGGRLWVAPGQQQEDGFYSLGLLNGKRHVMASSTGRGKFADRGPLTGDDGFRPDSVDRLYHYSRGWGMASAVSVVGQVADFNDKAATAWEIGLGRTRDGRKLTQVQQIFAVGSHIGVGVSRSFNWCEPTVLEDGTELVVGGGGIGITMQGDYVPVYLRGEVGGHSQVPLQTLQYQLPSELLPYTLSPTARLAQVKYLRPVYPQVTYPGGVPKPVPHPINDAGCPGLVMHFSDDAGATWTPLSFAAAAQEMVTTLLPMRVPHDHDYWAAVNTLFDRAILSAGIVGSPAPVSRQRSLACMNVPYAVADASTAVGWRLMCKAKLVAVDAVAHTVTELVTLLDDEFDRAIHYFGSAAAIGGGMLYLAKPQQAGDFRDNPVQCWFVDSSGNRVLKGQLPQPAWLTGSLFAIDRRTVGCTTYIDGAYRLYQSTDLGTTWKPRALIAEAPQPARVAGADFLTEFEFVTQLRDAGRPANPMPGAPWAIDARLPAPQ